MAKLTGTAPRTREVAMVNPSATKPKKKKKNTTTTTTTKTVKKSNPKKKKHPKKGAAGKAEKTTRRRRRRRNPGRDHKGLLGALVGGAVAEVVSTPGAHFAGGMVDGTKHPHLQRGARAGARLVVGALGYAVASAAPNVGKGMVAQTGGALVREAGDHMAVDKKGQMTLFAKLGFGEGDIIKLPTGDTIYWNGTNAVLEKKGAAAGTAPTVLMGVEPMQFRMRDEQGQLQGVVALMELPGDQMLVQNARGGVEVLDGLNMESLRGIVMVNGIVALDGAEGEHMDGLVVRDQEETY